jgi:hypothetical protein
MAFGTESASTFHVVVQDTGKTQIVFPVLRGQEPGVIANHRTGVAILLLLSFCVRQLNMLMVDWQV